MCLCFMISGQIIKFSVAEKSLLDAKGPVIVLESHKEQGNKFQ